MLLGWIWKLRNGDPMRQKRIKAETKLRIIHLPVVEVKHFSKSTEELDKINNVVAPTKFIGGFFDHANR